jgi:hypothetical protein
MPQLARMPQLAILLSIRARMNGKKREEGVGVMRYLEYKVTGLLPQWYTSMDERTQEEEWEHRDILMQRRLKTGQLLVLMPRYQGVTLAIGPRPPFHRVGVFDDTWDYMRMDIGMIAFCNWQPDEEREPMGWTRHITTGRYRLHGDPSLEYIKSPEGDPQEQATSALKISRGADYVIQGCAEQFPQESFLPGGTRCFLFHGRNTECPHTPTCQWLDTVFHYRDRCVVYSLDELVCMKRRALLDRLASDDLS